MRNRLRAALLLAGSFALLPVVARAEPVAAPGADLAWQGNTLGESSAVPSPWTPVVVDGETVRVWGREVAWGASPLPRRIVSQGQDLLAGPFELQATTAAGPVALTGGPPVVRERDDTRAILSQRASGGGLTLATTTVVEFDGMVGSELALGAEVPTEVRAFRMVIPLAPSVAEVMSRHLAYDFKQQRTNKRDYRESMVRVTKRIDLAFNPEVWLGNREVGLAWAAETNAQWDVVDEGRALSIVPGPDRTELVVSFIDHPVRLDGTRRFEFALFPTPLKPVDPRLRALRLASSGRFKSAFAGGVDREAAAAYAITSARNEMFAPWESLPWSDGGRKHREVRRKLRELGIHYVPYGALWYTNAFHPVGRRFYDEWHVEPASAASRLRWKRYDLGAPRDLEVEAGRHWDGYRVCASPRSYADFVVWAYLDAIRSEQIDGIYFDHGDLSHSCQNESHGHFHAAKGPQKKVYFGLFHARELLKRLWVAAKGAKPDILIVQHQAHTLKSLDSFVDVAATGEVMNAVFAGSPNSRAIRRNPALYVPDYDRVPQAALDYDYLDTLGFESRMLPQVKYLIADYWEAHPERYRFYSDKMLRHTLLRGIRLWAGNMDQASLIAAWRALDHVAPLDADTTFHPYWEPDPGLRASSPETLLAHYQRSGRLLLIVGTTSRQTKEETIEVMAPHAYTQAVDASDGTPVAFDGKRLRVVVPSERYRAVLLTK